jgi:hypothetical protein
LLVFIDDQLTSFVFIEIDVIILEFCVGRLARIEVTCSKKNVKMDHEDRKEKQGERFAHLRFSKSPPAALKRTSGNASSCVRLNHP